MTVTEQINDLKQYTVPPRQPEFILEKWRAELDKCCQVPSVKAENLGNPFGVYETLALPVGDRVLSARCIHPADGKQHPLVLMYHDLNRGVRGWHHMTRFLAFGCGVVALEAEPFSGDWMSGQVDFRSRFLDALRLGKAATQLPWVNREQVTAWGEGFGGGLALAAAALVPGVTRAAALNPMPADLRSMGMDGMDDVDLVNLAPTIRGQVLFGSCLLDSYAPPRAQAAIYNAIACEKFWRIYPKYGHERVNAFENDLVRFLKNGLDDFRQEARTAGAQSKESNGLFSERML